MAIPSELSLDCKPHHSFSMLLKSLRHHNHSDQVQNLTLEEFVSRLEEERLKIDAFKRELPLCMQLLTNAMDESRQKLEALRGNEGKKSAILEEFIPLKHSTFESSDKASSNTNNNTCDKANWMISAQLWSQASEETKPQYSTSPSLKNNKEADDHIVGSDVNPNKLHININGGAFLPFTNNKERVNSNQCSSSTELQALPELALASADEKQTEENKKLYSETIENSGKGGSNNNNGGDEGKGIAAVSSCEAKTTGKTAASTSNSTTQSHRKARRCWSPDLHRRFVNALQMLGGSQVATPKQIRELMKVDGLTNDEVKSHLQKYRLHTRRPGPNPQVGGSGAPQLVVLGGIWVPSTTGTPNALFSPHPVSHAPAPHYFPHAPPAQDLMYTASTPQSHNHTLHQRQHQHRLNGYKTTSQRQRSPESESIEDGKSQSSSENQREDSKGDGAISLKL